MQYLWKYFLCWIILVPILAGASPIDTIAAYSIATHHITSQQTSSLHAGRPRLQLIHAEPSMNRSGESDYYLFTINGDQGFVIIAGEDRARQVLAYGSQAINIKQVPDNLQWLLSHYTEQIEYLHSHPDALPQPPQQQSGITVQPMLTTRWDQGTPYRNLCPLIDGNPATTGCVATAMAQIMNFWKYPEILPSLPGYTTSTHSIQVPALPPISAEWNLMQESYKEGSYTQDQAIAVATLMRYCGQSAKTDYTIANSGAWLHDQLDGFKRFGYSDNATCIWRSNYTESLWNDLILDDLTAGRPVSYAGRDGNTSHNFVIDGYDGSRYHINWGWSGNFDGYFELDAMSVSGYKPTDNQQMLHGIAPDKNALPNYGFDIATRDFNYIYLANDCLAVAYKAEGYTGEVRIPDIIHFNGKAYTVTAIDNEAFSRCDLTSIEMPNTITNIGKRAFSQCIKLQQVNLSQAITLLPDNVFAGCISLNDIIIPDQVTDIGNSAFKGTSLSSVILPDKVTCIGDSSFMRCDKLSHVSIKGPVVTIGAGAFTGCAQLQAITIPEGVMTIGEKAFGNTSLIEISLPSTLQSLGASAFEGCHTLHSVSFNGQLDLIDKATFKNCETLSSINLPTSLKRIDNDAFKGTGLTDIILPDQITDIGSCAFMNCTALTHATIGADVSSLGDQAFANAPLDSLNCLCVMPPTASADCFASRVYQEACLTVPFTSQHLYGIVEPWNRFSHIMQGDSSGIISDNEFIYYKTGEHSVTLASYRGCSDSVVIPESIAIGDSSLMVTAIGKCAFMFCNDIKSVIIPSTVTAIDNYAFYHCSGINRLALPNQVSSLGAGAFESCDHLLTIQLNEGLKEIGYNAFAKCTALSSIEIPTTVETIGHHAFSYCNGLTEILIPDAVTSLGSYVFDHCEHLKSAHLGHGVTSIPDGCFGDCVELSDIKMPNTITRFGNNAFRFCHQLSDLTFPDSLKTIGNNAFTFTSIKNCHLDGSINITNIGDNAFMISKITEVVIGNNLLKMGNEAFRYCSDLERVVIGDSLHAISNAAFADCSKLTDVSIGSGLDTIYTSAFNGCRQIATITCTSIVPPFITATGFDEKCYANATLYVPMSAIGRYRSAREWKKFKHIVGVMNPDINGDKEVNIADVNTLIDSILAGEHSSNCDLNGDSEVNIADANILIDVAISR